MRRETLEAAEELLPYACRFIALMDEATERIQSRNGRQHIKLRLGASYTPATYFLLRHYEIDVTIVSLPNEQEKGLHIIPLIEDELQLMIQQNPGVGRCSHLPGFFAIKRLLHIFNPASPSPILSFLMTLYNYQKLSIFDPCILHCLLLTILRISLHPLYNYLLNRNQNP
ncbi:hypothetical protein D3C75_259510 [compost metagenome]